MRCFLAIELPVAVRRQLAALQQRLPVPPRAVRWTPPEQIHLTLKFFGDVPNGQIAAISGVVARVAAAHQPIDLEIAGTGCFPPNGPPRVLWAGVIGPPPALLACQQQYEQAFEELGFAPEGRLYRPHLTLGRVREGAVAGNLRAAMHEEQSFSAGRFLAQEVLLFQSLLGRDGARHIPIARSPLGRAE